MKEIDEILDRTGRSIDTIITELKTKSVNPPKWSEMKKVLIPRNHKIYDDHTQRRDREVENGIEEAARIILPLEMLLAKRVNQFTFTIPVRREYTNVENEDQRAIAKALERIYQECDIDTVNFERGLAYFMSCEIYTLWFAVRKPNTLYGFKSDWKLHCKTFSPYIDDMELYPLMDEYGDMICMSIQYNKTIADEKIEFFETWTADHHYKWKRSSDNEWQDDLFYTNGEGIATVGRDCAINKIPGAYAWRPRPIYEQGTPRLREDAEYKHSEDSDILAYNAAPLIKVVGKMIGDEKKYESRRLIRVEGGGNVDYVSWNGSTEAVEAHIRRDVDWFWSLNQMPDISFRNLMSLGNIGYDARQMMLTDAFLKIGEESRPLQQMFRRECNVIKAFLKMMNPKWKEEDIDNVLVKHIITPYIPKDEQLEITKRMAANGGKPLESQRESIQRYGRSNDVDATIEELNNEREEAMKQQMQASLQAMATGTPIV